MKIDIVVVEHKMRIRANSSGNPMKHHSMLFLRFAVAAAFTLTFAATVSAQKRIISLEVSTANRAEVTTQQRWMETLSNVGADSVRSRTGRGLVQPKIEEVQYGKTISIEVTGVISGKELMLPGASFGIRDVEGIRDYVKKLRDDGSKVALADKKAFGLTSEQLVGVGQELMAPVTSSTRGKPTGKVVEELSSQLRSPVRLDDFARDALAGKSLVGDELEGLSTGTALAAALRPLGLVVAPHREQGKSLEIHIVDSRSTDEHWPIGWPIEKPVSQIEPKLLEKLGNVEIKGFALKPILDRFEQRLGVPFLYDQNNMARKGIELETTKVTFVRKKTSYLVALNKVLAQTKPMMQAEVRVDENGKAFLWISTTR